MAAKSVAAGVKAAWAAAKKDFKESNNTDNLKQDVREVMGIAKSKASLVKRATTSSSSSQAKIALANSKVSPQVNPDVGSELLSHFKDEWEEIHQSTVSSSLVATKMDADLKLLSQSITRSHTIVGRCREEFSHLKEVLEALDEAQSKIECIGKLIQQVEDEICKYSLAKAELATERRKHSLRRQNEQEIADNRSKVDHLRKVLLNEEQMTLKLKHDMETKELRERQMAFQDLFDKQMADYRTRGKVDRPIGEDGRERSRSQLEEVVIEDEDGTASLHEFLSDVVLEDEDTPTQDSKEGEGISPSQEGEPPASTSDEGDTPTNQSQVPEKPA